MKFRNLVIHGLAFIAIALLIATLYLHALSGRYIKLNEYDLLDQWSGQVYEDGKVIYTLEK